MIKGFTTIGEVSIVKPSDIVSLIFKEPTAHQLCQYNMTTSMPPIVSSGNFAQSIQYSRQLQVVEDYSDYEDFVLRSFVRQIHGSVHESNHDNVHDAIEDLAVECAMNFSVPTHAFFLGSVLVMGQFDKDTLRFKESVPGSGALLVFKPTYFAVSKLNCEIDDMFKSDPMYEQYGSKISIIETLKKLNFS